VRRSDREIRDRGACDAIIRECRVCRLGLCDRGEPYVVPMCFGYDGTAVYFHAAQEGRKIEILRANNRVCLEFDILDRVVETRDPCRWEISYRSVIAWGRAELLEEMEEKRYGLSVLTSRYSPRAFSFPDEAVRRTAVIRVVIECLTGKGIAG